MHREDTPGDHGKLPQGCEACGGLRHNVQGKLRLGSGLCAECGGKGKIWPVVSNRRRGFLYSATEMSGSVASDSSPTSAKMATSRSLTAAGW